MTRPMMQFDHAAPTASVAMVALQGLLVRASYVGVTGIVIELFGRFALTAFHAAIVHSQPRHHG